jgi:hypothetical protein
MKRLAILYGTNEGPALTWRLKPLLAAEGYELTTNIVQADCIVTHSGGILLLPPDLHNKVVFVTVPSTGYTGSLAGAMMGKIALDIKHAWQQGEMLFWLRKTAVNLYYAVNIPRTVKLYAANRKLGHALPACQAKKVAVLVQPHDPWSRDMPPETVNAHPTYIFMTMPGQHDDLWQRPAAYVKLLAILDEQQ